jgi:XRE family transcriptional regulator, regulator of sulfur utilization
MARQSALSLQVRLGQKINRLRKSRGWTFIDLAIDSGVAKSTVQEVVKGSTDPRLNTIDALAGSFDMTLSELFKGL